MLTLRQCFTFHVELSDLHTCSSVCPARSAGQQCLSGLEAEKLAAARFPVRGLIE